MSRLFAKGTWSRRLLLCTVTCTAVPVGIGAVTYRRRLKENKSVLAETYNEEQNKGFMTQCLDGLKSPKTFPFIELFQYETCPFCGTVRAFLDSKGIPYTEIEVEPMFKHELQDSAYKKVPQLRMYAREKSGTVSHDGVYLVDSEIIVDTFSKALGETPADAKWREWARSTLVRLLVLNLNATVGQAVHAFDYIDHFGQFPYWNKLFLKAMGGPVMYLVSELKTRPQLSQALHKPLNTIEERREVLRDELGKFADELNKRKTPFLGGSTPNTADTDIYGVVQSVRGQPPYDFILNSNPNVTQWMGDMEARLSKIKASS